MTLRHQFEPENNVRLSRLCGPLDAHLRRIEDALEVVISRRGAHLAIEGPVPAAARALQLMQGLYASADRPIYEQSLELAIAEAQAALRDDHPAAHEAAAADGAIVAPVKVSNEDAALDTPGAAPAPVHAAPTPAAPHAAPKAVKSGARARKANARERTAPQQPTPAKAQPPLPSASARSAEPAAGAASPVLHTRRSELRGRTPNQVRYLEQILSHDVTFGIGPAGTGKTFLAVACAVDAMERHGVQRLILTRPAVEAGERLGFLPGDLAQKVDPYLRPLYDALYDLMGFERVSKAFEKGLIEIAPLAFMRGRTLNHAFVILDEAQNTTREQMKMFLTRLGFGSRCVVTGDVSQIDLPAGMPSGLVEAERVLAAVDGVAFTRFTPADVVRHPLVARIVEAYEAVSQDPR